MGPNHLIYHSVKYKRSKFEYTQSFVPNMFHSSTHRRWLVPDLEQIRARRAEANEKAVKQLTRAAQQRTSSGALPQFLTAEQELLICHETEQKLVLSCGAIPNIPLSPNVLEWQERARSRP